MSLAGSGEFARTIDSAGEVKNPAVRAVEDRLIGRTMVHADKRREARTTAAVPLYFRGGKGVTDDLAATGVFFWTDCAADFAVGDHINFTLVIAGSGTTATSECSGKIVRVLARQTPKGVAVKLSHPALSRFIE
jgi:hypothetical protein